MSHFLGIDVSTTATKAILVDERGEVISVASSEYKFKTPYPLWSEQDPRFWWQGTLSSIRRLLDESAVDANSVQGIGLTGQMHGLTILDGQGEVRREHQG